MTKRQSIADRLRAKGFPPLSEEQYQANISTLVPTVCFCEETAMTTDIPREWDEPSAWDQLAFKVIDDRGILKPRKGVALTDKDISAIEYLCNEYDYGYQP